jgi:pyruvate kinase
LEFALEAGVDFIALSFVVLPRMGRVKAIIYMKGKHTPVIQK